MTRAPTYPIHRNRRNSISIRFSVRSIRFSRCGLRAVGPRPPASLALGGKEIHYPPRGAESRGSFRSTGPPQPGGAGGRGRTGRPARRSEAQAGREGKGRGRTGLPGRATPRQGGRRTKHSSARGKSWGRTGRHHSRRADAKMRDTNSEKDRRKRISVGSQTRKAKAAYP